MSAVRPENVERLIVARDDERAGHAIALMKWMTTTYASRANFFLAIVSTGTGYRLGHISVLKKLFSNLSYKKTCARKQNSEYSRSVILSTCILCMEQWN
jgi:hypothetical protein